MEDLKLARENDRCVHKERLHEVEREVLKEKDKLLKEKEQQVKEIRENLLNLSKANLDKVNTPILSHPRFTLIYVNTFSILYGV